MQAVIGGPGANTFAFQDQAIFDGTLAGTLSSTTHDYSNNTLDYSLYTSDVEVNLRPRHRDRHQRYQQHLERDGRAGRQHPHRGCQ